MKRIRPIAPIMLISAASLTGIALGGRALAAVPPAYLEEEFGLKLAAGGHAADQPSITYSVPVSARAAWAAFRKSEGAAWQAYFDLDTGVPGRIYGGSLYAPGSSNSEAIAEQRAQRMLSSHLALFAPGASERDFLLASNDFDGDQRTVGFLQYHQGLEVLGGQLSFRFKKDRLFMIGSEAFPNVAVPAVPTALSSATATEQATKWIRRDFGPTAKAERTRGPVILPIKLSRQVRYHVVYEVRVSTIDPIGSWLVYIAADDGAAIARRQTLMFASGTVKYNAPERWPGSTRIDYPARDTRFTLDGATAVSDASGLLTWPTAAPVQVVERPEGPLVKVNNGAGPTTSTTAVLRPDGTAVWNESHHELADAQVIAYVATQQVKERTRRLAPNLGWLDGQIQVNVNLNSTCNAYSDGQATNFFKSSSMCENTARLPDVVFHEFGHTVHFHAIIRGVGRFDTALSEGASDYLSGTLHNDPKMGRGFFRDNRALRDLDPPSSEAMWPDDINPDPHITGLIFGGAMWDLRKNLIASLGETAGVEVADSLWFAVLRRAVDIPSSYAEILAADDDDGDLSNGTPHICDINQAFALHALADRAAANPVGTPIADGLDIALPAQTMSTCASGRIASATLSWNLRRDPSQAGTVALSPGPNGYAAQIPQPALTPQHAGEVVRYKVEVRLMDGKVLSFPDNPADPMYEVFVGESINLYCTDFEGDPFAEGWAHALVSGPATGHPDDWQWGAPAGLAGSGDPKVAFSGMNAVGNDLGITRGWNGKYTRQTINALNAPPVEVMGHTNIHVQYRRWLTVEDGLYDHASIYANDTKIWSNAASAMTVGNVHHLDREWRFHDVDLSAAVRDGSARVKFEMASDAALEFGGWTIDDLCVVAVPTCGNGVVEGSEACDDGVNDGTRCTADCRVPAVVTPPACPNGATRLADGTCPAEIVPPPSPDPGTPMQQPPATLANPAGKAGCGCSTSSPGDAGSLGAFVLALVSLGLFRLLGRVRRR